jgi:hypothetical protein
MPIHDWNRVDAGIFHHFHQRWIAAISDALNAGLLPEVYYALAEQHAAGFGPDVLALQETDNGNDEGVPESTKNSGGHALLLAEPRSEPTAETDMEFYNRKQNAVAVRHVSGDRIVAMVEVVSPGNKGSRSALRSFIDKAVTMLCGGVHLLILDPIPPGRRDPHGIHAAIWEDFAGQDTRPPTKPLTLVAYEAADGVRAFVEPVAVGEPLPDMPLFLKRNACVYIPLEQTYQTAFAAVPQRWRKVLNPPSAP